MPGSSRIFEINDGDLIKFRRKIRRKLMKGDVIRIHRITDLTPNEIGQQLAPGSVFHVDFFSDDLIVIRILQGSTSLAGDFRRYNASPKNSNGGRREPTLPIEPPPQEDVLLDPSDITGNVLWMDASETDWKTSDPQNYTLLLGVPVTSGNIDEWQDRSGNSNHTLQSVETSQPIRASNKLIQSLDFLETTTGFDFSLTGLSVFAVFSLSSGTLNTGVMGSWNSAGNDQQWALWASDPTVARETSFGTRSSAAVTTRPPFPYAKPNGEISIGGGVASPTGVETFHNGVGTGVSVAVDINDLTEPRTIVIGAYATNSPFEGDLYETIVFDSNLSTADRQKIEGYLAHKWGLLANLDVSHPYKVNPPIIP